jgi:hypothetical protein
MRRRALTATSIVATAYAAVFSLAACGSSTKTVTASSAPPASSQAATTRATTSAKPTSTPAPPTTSTATSSPGTAGTGTRSAPEPAFAQQQAGAQGADAAAAVVSAHGYTPNDTSEYRPNQTLRVLVATRTGSGDGYGQLAFFFVDGRFLGTDAKQASAKVRVVSQGDTEATLAYALYRPGDPLSSPSGEARVTFQLNDGRLTPLQKIPPASSSTGASRQ